MCDGRAIVLVPGLGSAARILVESFDRHGRATLLQPCTAAHKAKHHIRLWTRASHPTPEGHGPPYRIT